MARLRNALTQAQVFNVPADVFERSPEGDWPEGAAPTKKTLVFVDELQGAAVGWGKDLRAGERMPRREEKVLPGSITFLAKEALSLPNAFLDVLEVKLALFNGSLMRLADEPQKAAPTEAPPPAPAPNTKKKADSQSAGGS